MVDTTGKVWITDFGLACFEHGESLTVTGGVVGTAAYMSPEQATGLGAIDFRSDLYSLGATLGELAVVPNAGDGGSGYRQTIEEKREVTGLRQWVPEIPVDLETIIVKLLAIEPADRYASASELLLDLRAFYEGRSITARPMGTWERTRRWIRRHQTWLAGVCTTAMLVMLLFTAGMWIYSREISRYAARLTDAVAAADAAVAKAEQLKRKAVTQKQLADRMRRRAEASDHLARRMSYRNAMRWAFELRSRNDFRGTLGYLEQQRQAATGDTLGLEWYLLFDELRRYQLLGRHQGGATDCVIFPSQTTAASVGEEGRVVLYDLAKTRPLRTFEPGLGSLHAIAVSPDGQTLAVGGTPSLRSWGQARVYLLDPKSGRVIRSLQSHATTIESIEFSPDGKSLAAGSRYGTLQITDLESYQTVSIKTDGRNESLGFSPAGSQLLGRRKSNEVGVWDVQSGKLGRTLPFSRGAINGLAWGQHDRLFLSSKGAARIWALAGKSGAVVREFQAPLPEPQEITTFKFDKRDQFLLAGDSSGRVHRWQTHEIRAEGTIGTG